MKHRSASGFEIAGALAVLAVGIVAQVILVAGKVVFTRPLWIDEVMTQGFTSAPTVGYIITALRHGAETHLPTAFILMRWFCAPLGGPTPVTLRAFALASVILGLTGLYATLRLAFDRPAATIGVLAAWSHHLVMRHALDARFYGPMLAGSTWFAYFLLASRQSQRPGLLRIFTGLSALLLFTVHYFGCFGAGFILLFDWVLNRRDRRCIVNDLLTILPATIALLACVPLYLGQRRAFGALTWMHAARLGDIEVFITAIFPAMTIAAVIGFWWISQLISKPPATKTVSEIDTSATPPLSRVGGLFGLTFMFVPIVLLSFTVQNFMVNRYGIVTMAGMAAPLSLLAAQISSRLRCALIAALIFLSCGGLVGISKADAAFGALVRARVALVQGLPADAPAVFLSSDEPYYIDSLAPNLTDRAWLAGFDLSADSLEKQPPLFGIEAAQNFGRYFGFPRVVTLKALKDTPHFFLVGSLPDLSVIKQFFPNHTVHVVSSEVAELQRE